MEAARRCSKCIGPTYTALITDAIVTAFLAVCITCVEARNIARVRGDMGGPGVCLPDIQLITTHSTAIDVSL